MSSRSLQDLLPDVATLAEQHRAMCLDKRIDLLIYCTLRDADEQGQIYCQGRTEEQIQAKRDSLRARSFRNLAALLKTPAPGKRITNAGPGESFHQYGRAYDCVPLIGGKPNWSTSGDSADLWERVGRIGELAGLEWAGRWTTFREFPHFQLTGGLVISNLMTQRYGDGAVTAHVAPALLAAIPAADEGSALRTLLGEAVRRVCVVQTQTGVGEAAAKKVFDLAKKVAQLNATSWAGFWIRQPQQLPQDLRNLLGGSPVVTLGEGEDLQRKATPYALADVDEAQEMFDAYTGA